MLVRRLQADHAAVRQDCRRTKPTAVSTGFVDGGEKWMRDALPNATFVGLTGSPLLAGDKVTRYLFGEQRTCTTPEDVPLLVRRASRAELA